MSRLEHTQLEYTILSMLHPEVIRAVWTMDSWPRSHYGPTITHEELIDEIIPEWEDEDDAMMKERLFNRYLESLIRRGYISRHGNRGSNPDPSADPVFGHMAYSLSPAGTRALGEVRVIDDRSGKD